eukprot:scaffold158524_cov32-Tisochrysis_lutea.AAC.1
MLAARCPRSEQPLRRLKPAREPKRCSEAGATLEGAVMLSICWAVRPPSRRSDDQASGHFPSEEWYVMVKVARGEDAIFHWPREAWLDLPLRTKTRVRGSI